MRQRAPQLYHQFIGRFLDEHESFDEVCCGPCFPTACFPAVCTCRLLPYRPCHRARHGGLLAPLGSQSRLPLSPG